MFVNESFHIPDFLLFLLLHSSFFVPGTKLPYFGNPLLLFIYLLSRVLIQKINTLVWCQCMEKAQKLTKVLYAIIRQKSQPLVGKEAFSPPFLPTIPLELILLPPNSLSYLLQSITIKQAKECNHIYHA